MRDSPVMQFVVGALLGVLLCSFAIALDREMWMAATLFLLLLSGLSVATAVALG